MTYKEALENRKQCLEYLEQNQKRVKPECLEAVRLSVEALEKQIPMKPNHQYAGEFGEQTEYYCSSCDDYLSNTEDDDMHFCQKCGQAIDWSDVK